MAAPASWAQCERALLLTRGQSVHVQHAPLLDVLQLVLPDLGPGDVRDPQLHVPERLQVRLNAFVQSPGDLSKTKQHNQ